MPQTDASETVFTATSPWADESDQVLDQLEVTPDGLSPEEVRRRRELTGKNAIRVPSRLTALTLFLSQFKSPLIIALIIAGVIAVAFGKWVEAGVIFLAVAANTVLGFWQEHKAEKSLELLNTYTKHYTRVRRNGEEHQVETPELVPGDIIIVTQGARVPADARIISVNNCAVDESLLTGESLTVKKQVESVDAGASVGDRVCMLFNGTSVVEGTAEAVVTGTGSKTEYGKIAELVAEKQQKDTPLQRSIKEFSVKAGIVLFGMGALLFALGYGGHFLPFFEGKGLEEMFFIAVAAIVSAVPEGLPVAVTVVLAIGVERLAKRKGVVRKLLAAETLGSTTTILTDKTGTLTEARMKVGEISLYGDLSEDEIIDHALTNTDITIENPDDPPAEWKMHGEPLEQAIAREAGARKLPLLTERTFEVFEQLPFDTRRKYSATVVSQGDGAYALDILGAPERIVEHCEMSDTEKQKVLDEVTAKAEAGSRMLALATRSSSSYDGDIEKAAKSGGFSLVALIAFRDPIRMSVKGAVERISEAGVRTVVVTGDHAGTASYVASKLGIMDGRRGVIDDAELNQLSDDELRERLDDVSVFARVTPAQKVRILKAFQARGEIVAVTGDGVNDAPALKTADIGVAMGAGTDVAKSASDLIILDNNYETIVAAIEEGRKIIFNLRKVIIFLLSDSFDELILIGGAIIAAVNLPLSAIQILFVKVFTDTLPALSFPFDTGGSNVGRKPQQLRRKLFDRETKVFTIGRGLFSAVLLFALYLGLLWFTDYPDNMIRTFIFASFSTYILFLVFPLRSLTQNIWEFNPFNNWYINSSVALGMAMTAIAIYVPLARDILGTSYLPPVWLVGVLLVGIVNIASMEALKWWFHRR